MPEKSARAYHRDLPDAPLHLLGGGHWLLETHLNEVVPLVEEFLRASSFVALLTDSWVIDGRGGLGGGLPR